MVCPFLSYMMKSSGAISSGEDCFLVSVCVWGGGGGPYGSIQPYVTQAYCVLLPVAYCVTCTPLCPTVIAMTYCVP